MFVVNAGEFLELATRGCFCSAMHRVVNRTNLAALLRPFFVSPGLSTILRLAAVRESTGRPQFAPIHIGNTLAAFFPRSLWPSIGAGSAQRA